MAPSEEHVRVDVTDGVATIELNRPGAFNALSPEMRDGLLLATTECERNEGVRCVVLKGSGENFMAGGDIKGFQRSLTDDRDAHLAGFELRVVKSHQILHQLIRMPKPVIALVQGAVAGFGLGLALAADIVVARVDAYFLVAQRHMGLSCDGGTTYLLPRVIGEKKSLELALLGERVSAAHALEMGMINWVVERSEFESFSGTVIGKLANGPTQALGRTKRLIRTSFDRSWQEQSHAEAENVALAVMSQDHKEGLSAFLEKRRPEFIGR